MTTQAECPHGKKADEHCHTCSFGEGASQQQTQAERLAAIHERHKYMSNHGHNSSTSIDAHQDRGELLAMVRKAEAKLEAAEVKLGSIRTICSGVRMLIARKIMAILETGK